MEPGDLFKWVIVISLSAVILALAASFIKYCFDVWFKE